jgi:hypothetical protein
MEKLGQHYSGSALQLEIVMVLAISEGTTYADKVN